MSMSGRRLAKAKNRKLRMINFRAEQELQDAEPETRKRVNVFLRPWVLDAVDQAREITGISRSKMIDIMLGWMVESMITDQTLEKQYGRSLDDESDALPVPDIDSDYEDGAFPTDEEDDDER